MHGENSSQFKLQIQAQLEETKSLLKSRRKFLGDILKDGATGEKLLATVADIIRLEAQIGVLQSI